MPRSGWSRTVRDAFPPRPGPPSSPWCKSSEISRQRRRCDRTVRRMAMGKRTSKQAREAEHDPRRGRVRSLCEEPCQGFYPPVMGQACRPVITSACCSSATSKGSTLARHPPYTPDSGLRRNGVQMNQSYPRHINFESVPNFRDLGGYRTRDGRTVAWRRLFRSGDAAPAASPDLCWCRARAGRSQTRTTW
jgi:hypothetical protein